MKPVGSKYMLTWFALLATGLSCLAQQRIVVAQDGTGQFTTIQAALNSLKKDSRGAAVVYIKNGVYAEKLFIERGNITLQGENREHTIISASIVRDEWRCEHLDDWGVAAMNIGANNMKDASIYRVNNGDALKWGNRVFYFNCTRPAGNYEWFQNNISDMAVKEITVASVFNEKWKPV
ncbi:MAG TPA: pectinesterase family protein [Phnomibacter sp.]|nr:pectinesterase family protein [Phnomibacter sp.]